MRKLRLWIVSSLFIFAVLAGCGDQNDVNSNNNSNNDTNNNAEVNNNEDEEIIVLTLSKNDGDEIVSEEEISINEGDILLDVLTEHFDVEHDGGYITSINDIEADESKKEAWFFFVNDEMAPVGAGEYELSANDKVNFDLQKWE